MPSSSLRARIAELKRSSIRRPIEPPSAQLEPSGTGVEMPPPSVIPKATATDARLKLSLDDIAEGSEKLVPPGRFYLIDQSIEALIPHRGPELANRFVRLLEGLSGLDDIANDEFETFQALSHSTPDELVFVDIEATGFTPGTPLFLIGVVTVEENGLRVQQMLARDYAEEGALLYHLRKLFERVRTVVSFNGKTYDLPYIRDRMTYFGYRMPYDFAHIDLLHEGRRRYRDRLVNCKLQTLERAICGRGRIEDIPGSEIPDAYHNFVRTGNAAEMRDILHHNALDLVTLVEVVLFMLEGRKL